MNSFSGVHTWDLKPCPHLWSRHHVAIGKYLYHYLGRSITSRTTAHCVCQHTEEQVTTAFKQVHPGELDVNSQVVQML